jgi:hypothetical protein
MSSGAGSFTALSLEVRRKTDWLAGCLLCPAAVATLVDFRAGLAGPLVTFQGEALGIVFVCTPAAGMLRGGLRRASAGCAVGLGGKGSSWNGSLSAGTVELQLAHPVGAPQPIAQP